MIDFSSLVGNSRAKAKLQVCFKKQAWRQPLCFHGIDGIGKSLFAKAVAKAIISQDLKRSVSDTHPDIIALHPVGKLGLHAVESVRSFCDEVYIAPFEARIKVLIIHEADRMLPSSANALLKTLEEPPESSLIILLTSAFDKILPTIRSRLRTIYFEPLTSQEIMLALGMDESLALEAHGSCGQAKLLMEGKKDPALNLIERLLSKRLNYIEFKSVLSEIDASFSEHKKALEEKFLKEALQPFGESDVTAKQKGEIEKNVEGALAIAMGKRNAEFFLSLFNYFRDLHVMYHGGREGLLVHRPLASQMFEAATSREPIGLERVEDAVAKALLSLERSTPLSFCVETLFLKLNLI